MLQFVTGSQVVEALVPLPDRPQKELSVSVDCDGLADYLNFAVKSSAVERDLVTYRILIANLLEVFERRGIRATFFCIGKPLQSDPQAAAVMRRAVAAGHRIANHTLSHPDMSMLDEAGQEREVTEGHRAILEATGVAPTGYRGPAYFVSPAILGALDRLGYRYDSSACPARFMQLALRALAVLKPNYQRKSEPPLAHLFKTDRQSVLRLKSGGRLIEWPIPIAYGLPFYGTFHSILPRRVFFEQLRLLSRRAHIHYELHPIEVINQPIAHAYPWLPTARVASRRNCDLVAWLDERLAALMRGRHLTTLEDLSAAHLAAL